ncbi:OmpA family protein [Marinibacterium sp. SX1]|uniref:OmpA family protein n=1 Tax=Marinibacterium sp. SX1 TaxID=3388424 RepID=UPI003D1869CB
MAVAQPALAFQPDLPAAAREISQRLSDTAYDLPAGPWSRDGMDSLTITGQVVRRTWRIEEGLTTRQVTEPLVEQMRAAGYAPVFTCEARACGGFDFRFAIDVVPAPDMFVDLADFRYVSAMDGDGNGVTLLVSRGRNAVWLQLTEIARATPGVPGDLARALVETGRLVLEDIPFGEGATLEPGPIPVFDVLAAFLDERPDTRLAIVAHSAEPADGDATRAEGLAEARSVRARLIADHGVDPARVEALWLGPFAPRASPLDATGQSVNRRIEAVLLPQHPATAEQPADGDADD